MFTGIIEELGTILSVRGRKEREFTLQASGISKKIKPGDSIAINGACQTAVEIFEDRFTFFSSQETVERTTLGSLKAGDKVNLERALSVSSLLDGHLVLGHVDCTTRIAGLENKGDSVRISFELSADISRYIAIKGSVAVDGISLTVSSLSDTIFSVDIIPFTFKNTVLTSRNKGDRVNIEVDIIARYLERLISGGKLADSKSESSLSLDFLSKHGFS